MKSVSPRLYVETLRHLKRSQISGRIRFWLRQPRPDLSPPPGIRARNGDWIASVERRKRQTGPETFRFLNVEGSLAEGWDNPNSGKLWRYNLHYFDDLNAKNACLRADWHHALIARWIGENPPGKGTGWEPYPTSLRIVNWTKWALSGHDLDGTARASLAVQARWLAKRLEYHLLGNHLLANAKALVFAGVFFSGQEADRWRAKGLTILARQLREQILPDGGHFELSTMYHAIVLEDLLDLVNLAQAFPGTIDRKEIAAWRGSIGAMRHWLAAMSHPDGEIAFFNDAAIGIAARPKGLESYARRLGFQSAATQPKPAIWLRDSGYVRLQLDQEATALLDIGEVGPRYLPGHAHADTLSFEFSFKGRRLLVNSGTSTYEIGAERIRQRGTAAHNAVVVNGQDSSEVWAAFRVARRASPGPPDVELSRVQSVSCAHDGYRRIRGRPVHRREWTLAKGSLRIADQVIGRTRSAESRFHFHPDVVVHLDGFGSRATGIVGRNVPFQVDIKVGDARIDNSTWHPEFGINRASKCLVVTLRDGCSVVEFQWRAE